MGPNNIAHAFPSSPKINFPTASSRSPYKPLAEIQVFGEFAFIFLIASS
jgi:hypothetical protein